MNNTTVASMEQLRPSMKPSIDIDNKIRQEEPKKQITQ